MAKAKARSKSKTPRKPTQAERIAHLELMLDGLSVEAKGTRERLERTEHRLASITPRDIPSSCANCRFYASDTRKVGFGFCRRRPPVAAEHGFPRVRPTSWCGEWEA